jgi:hypothetical protein
MTVCRGWLPRQHDRSWRQILTGSVSTTPDKDAIDTAAAAVTMSGRREHVAKVIHSRTAPLG